MKKSEIDEIKNIILQEKAPQMKEPKGLQYISDIIVKIKNINSHAGIDKDHKNYRTLVKKMKSAIQALQDAKNILWK